MSPAALLENGASIRAGRFLRVHVEVVTIYSLLAVIAVAGAVFAPAGIASTQNGGRSSRPPFCVCLGLDYFFLAAFLAAFLTTFLAAFLVAMCLFSLSI